jgi:hypothetical protein
MNSTPGQPTDDTVQRVRCEFLEMPGLRLTEKQAGRLWGLNTACCSSILCSLVDAGFLLRTHDGAYIRADHSTVARAQRPVSES